MENESTKDIETKEPYYRYICSNTSVGFLNLLNENQTDGYKPIQDTLHRERCIDKDTGEVYFKREAYLYNTKDNGLNNDETNIRVLISEDIMESEFQYSKAKNDLKNLETRLLKDVDWETVGMEEYQTVKPTVKQKESYIYDKTSLEREWLENVERWLRHVKRLEKIHERAEGNPPWITEDETDLKAEKVFVEEIGEPEGES